MAKLISLMIFVACSLVNTGFALPSSPVNEHGGVNWAVLVAGSNTWMNYRHQADVCHAYQILHKNGIPDERIIVMMYDDIAHNEQNPTPGIIINRPNGPNVYKNVLKDYTKESVTAENFKNVLLGKEEAINGGSKKVLKSGPNDHVFINFVDHGAPGLVAFPAGELTAKEFNEVIHEMKAKEMFKELVIYLEACESGSMFDNILPDNTKVYATTASDPTHSSYACYYDSKRHTYLGDVYSVKWMENSDKANMKVESLIKQFTIVKNETKTSRVCKYGDMSFDTEDLDDFQGDPKSNSSKAPFDPAPLPKMDTVPAPDVPLAILRHSFVDATSTEQRQKYEKQLEALMMTRSKIEETMRAIAFEASQRDKSLTDFIMEGQKYLIKKFDCLHVATKMFSDKCYNIGKNEFATRVIYALVNMCEIDQITIPKIQSAISTVCK